MIVQSKMINKQFSGYSSNFHRKVKVEFFRMKYDYMFVCLTILQFAVLYLFGSVFKQYLRMYNLASHPFLCSLEKPATHMFNLIRSSHI